MLGAVVVPELPPIGRRRLLLVPMPLVMVDLLVVCGSGLVISVHSSTGTSMGARAVHPVDAVNGQPETVSSPKTRVLWPTAGLTGANLTDVDSAGITGPCG